MDDGTGGQAAWHWTRDVVEGGGQVAHARRDGRAAHTAQGARQGYSTGGQGEGRGGRGTEKREKDEPVRVRGGVERVDAEGEEHGEGDEVGATQRQAAPRRQLL